MSYERHQKEALTSVVCAVVTVSDTRTETTDVSGRSIREMLVEAGHCVRQHVIVRDEPEEVRGAVASLAGDPGCQVILINGGTGVAPRDRTYEAVCGLLEKRLDGFGELFRMLSFEEIGSGAMLSRAVAGIHAGKAVFCMPGSPNAVRLAMERLILPELGHIVSLLAPPGA